MNMDKKKILNKQKPVNKQKFVTKQETASKQKPASKKETASKQKSVNKKETVNKKKPVGKQKSTSKQETVSKKKTVNKQKLVNKKETTNKQKPASKQKPVSKKETVSNQELVNKKEIASKQETVNKHKTGGEPISTISVSKGLYHREVRQKLKKKWGYKSDMQVPKITKIVLSISTGQAVKNPKILNAVQKDLSLIAGQKAVITKAKKSISNFKLREGMPLGVVVTLRREKMWSFFDRLVHFALPKARDFKGMSPKSFDGKGNYNMGLKEHIVFPEINYDKVESIRGMNITINTSTEKDEEARDLLHFMAFPFRGIQQQQGNLTGEIQQENKPGIK